MYKNKTIICIICGEESFFSHKYNSVSKIFKNKDIFTCKKCEFSWAIDIKQIDLNNYYKKDYDLEIGRSKKYAMPETYFSDKKKQYKIHRSKQHLSTIKQYLKNKKNPFILDIGSGFGTTLNLSKKYFIQPKIFAFENDENSKKYLEYINAHIISGDCISSLNNLKITFDIIIMSHFLEHVSPYILKDFINIAYKLLNPGGILLIEVPNDNWQKYPIRKYSNPPHVNFFSIISLKKTFKKFSIVKCCSIRKPRATNKFFLSVIIEKIFLKICNIMFQILNKAFIPCVKDGSGTSLLLVAKKQI